MVQRRDVPVVAKVIGEFGALSAKHGTCERAVSDLLICSMRDPKSQDMRAQLDIERRSAPERASYPR